MRKTIYILFAILGMSLFAGCDDDKKDNNTPLAKQLVGEWRLTSWTGQAPQVFDAYIAFDGGSFTIYQKIESVKYQKYTGSYLLKGDVLREITATTLPGEARTRSRQTNRPTPSR